MLKNPVVYGGNFDLVQAPSLFYLYGATIQIADLSDLVPNFKTPYGGNFNGGKLDRFVASYI